MTAMDAMMAIASYPLALLTLAVVAIPLAIIAWRMRSIRIVALLPFVFGLAVLLLIQGFDALGGGELLTGLIYLLAGAAR
jgi:hypothetical protein